MRSEVVGIRLILGADESEGMLEGMLDGSETGGGEARETSFIALIFYTIENERTLVSASFGAS